VNVAKGLAFGRRKPLLGINHLEGHVYANWLDAVTAEPTFPLVALIVSGGHSDVVLADRHRSYRRLGRTRDDAAGEAFDKVARLLGLGFPGGPPIEREALAGDAERFRFPRAWLEPGSWDFSFSGLKTAVLHEVRALGVDPEAASAEERRARLPVADLAASFQAAVVDVLATKAVRAAETFGASTLALGGGVAANRTLLRSVEARSQLRVVCPPPRLCTDNAAMIAAAGFFRYQAGSRSDLSLDIEPSLPIA
jgi:N6-L-threonylcarbamoyladenine synthase